MMKVYMSRARNLCGDMTAICIESNLAYAIPYWTARKEANPAIFWILS
jgi:hypothetical protein